MSATHVFHTPHLGMPAIDVGLVASTAAGRSTSGPWPGDIVRVQDLTSAGMGVGEFIYLQGVAGTVRGSWVAYNPDDFTTALLATTIGSPAIVAVARAPVLATQWGWFQISGKCWGLAAAGFADNALVYATATPGQVGSAVTAGYRVLKSLGASAVGVPGAGLAEFEIDRPSITANTAN